MLNLNSTKIIIFLVACNSLLVPNLVHAQWWNPLAPKDFDDCVIKNLKSGMGEEAVRALQYSCMQKYPSKESAAEKMAAQKLDARYQKCNLDKNHYKDHIFIPIGGANRGRTSFILSNLKEYEYNSGSNSVEFQNKNAFGMSGVMVGFTNSKSCSSEIGDYKFSMYCAKGTTKDGVSSGAYGYLNCGAIPKSAKSMGTCLIGYSPQYDKFNDSLLAFMESNGDCIK